MIQTILIGLIFIVALIYLIRTVRKQFLTKNSCAKGCGCSAADINKVEKQLTSGTLSRNPDKFKN